MQRTDSVLLGVLLQPAAVGVRLGLRGRLRRRRLVELAQERADGRHGRRVKVVHGLWVDGDADAVCSRGGGGSATVRVEGDAERERRKADATRARVDYKRALEQVVAVLRDVRIEARVRVLEDDLLERSLARGLARGGELVVPRARGQLDPALAGGEVLAGGPELAQVG